MSQTERLESQPVTRHFIEDALDAPLVETLSTPPDGFRMPSLHAVRMHDARLSAFGGQVNAMDDDEGDEDDEDETYAATVYKRRESMREHSFRLPSQSSRRECLAEMKALGMAWSE